MSNQNFDNAQAGGANRSSFFDTKSKLTVSDEIKLLRSVVEDWQSKSDSEEIKEAARIASDNTASSTSTLAQDKAQIPTAQPGTTIPPLQTNSAAENIHIEDVKKNDETKEGWGRWLAKGAWSVGKWCTLNALSAGEFILRGAINLSLDWIKAFVFETTLFGKFVVGAGATCFLFKNKIYDFFKQKVIDPMHNAAEVMHKTAEAVNRTTEVATQVVQAPIESIKKVVVEQYNGLSKLDTITFDEAQELIQKGENDELAKYLLYVPQITNGELKEEGSNQLTIEDVTEQNREEEKKNEESEGKFLQRESEDESEQSSPSALPLHMQLLEEAIACGNVEAAKLLLKHQDSLIAQGRDAVSNLVPDVHNAFVSSKEKTPFEGVQVKGNQTLLSKAMAKLFSLRGCSIDQLDFDAEQNWNTETIDLQDIGEVEITFELDGAWIVGKCLVNKGKNDEYSINLISKIASPQKQIAQLSAGDVQSQEKPDDYINSDVFKTFLATSLNNYHNELEIIDLLLKNGVDKHTMEVGPGIQYPIPLQEAFLKQNKELFVTLLKNGVEASVELRQQILNTNQSFYDLLAHPLKEGFLSLWESMPITPPDSENKQEINGAAAPPSPSIEELYQQSLVLNNITPPTTSPGGEQNVSSISDNEETTNQPLIESTGNNQYLEPSNPSIQEEEKEKEELLKEKIQREEELTEELTEEKPLNETTEILIEDVPPGEPQDSSSDSHSSPKDLSQKKLPYSSNQPPCRIETQTQSKFSQLQYQLPQQGASLLIDQNSEQSHNGQIVVRGNKKIVPYEGKKKKLDQSTQNFGRTFPDSDSSTSHHSNPLSLWNENDTLSATKCPSSPGVIVSNSQGEDKTHVLPTQVSPTHVLPTHVLPNPHTELVVSGQNNVVASPPAPQKAVSVFSVPQGGAVVILPKGQQSPLNDLTVTVAQKASYLDLGSKQRMQYEIEFMTKIIQEFAQRNAIVILSPVNLDEIAAGLCEKLKDQEQFKWYMSNLLALQAGGQNNVDPFLSIMCGQNNSPQEIAKQSKQYDYSSLIKGMWRFLDLAKPLVFIQAKRGVQEEKDSEGNTVITFISQEELDLPRQQELARVEYKRNLLLKFENGTLDNIIDIYHFYQVMLQQGALSPNQFNKLLGGETWLERVYNAPKTVVSHFVTAACMTGGIVRNVENYQEMVRVGKLTLGYGFKSVQQLLTFNKPLQLTGGDANNNEEKELAGSSKTSGGNMMPLGTGGKGRAEVKLTETEEKIKERDNDSSCDDLDESGPKENQDPVVPDNLEPQVGDPNTNANEQADNNGVGSLVERIGDLVGRNVIGGNVGGTIGRVAGKYGFHVLSKVGASFTQNWDQPIQDNKKEERSNNTLKDDSGVSPISEPEPIVEELDGATPPDSGENTENSSNSGMNLIVSGDENSSSSDIYNPFCGY